jgi:hypothetical protein
MSIRVIDHNPGEAPDLVPPLQAACEAFMAVVNALPNDPHIVFVMVAADVTSPEKLENVRMVSNTTPPSAMELLGFIVEGTLRQSGPAHRLHLSDEPKH